jgi:hypothetical protein
MTFKIIEINKTLKFKQEQVWSIVGKIDRFDWVPGIDSITLEGNYRIFTLKPMGKIKEEIITKDDKDFKLVYTAISSPVPLKHHLATIHLVKYQNGCNFSWKTEIDPPSVGLLILQSMEESFAMLNDILNKEFIF